MSALLPHEPRTTDIEAWRAQIEAKRSYQARLRTLAQERVASQVPGGAGRSTPSTPEPPSSVTPREQARARHRVWAARYAAGESAGQIARTDGASPRHVLRTIAALGVPTRSRAEAQRLARSAS